MRDTTGALIRRVKRTEHGFLGIQEAADEVVVSKTVEESFQLARRLYDSEVYQARSLATFIFGRLAEVRQES